MKLAVVVIGDGRAEMLEKTVESLGFVLVPFDSRIMVDDTGDSDYAVWLERKFPQFTHVHGGRRGMAGAVQAGFDAVLETDADYVLWMEEDMMLIDWLPVNQACTTLHFHPELAQMCFKREAIDPSEGSDQLAAIIAQAANWGETATYTWHDFIFSMNPCVIPRKILELGWPAGPIGVGNEAGMTRKLLELGYLFGQWGNTRSLPWARHIGYAVRSEGWAL